MIPEKYRKDLAILRETAKQIINDLGLKDFEIIFSGNPANAFDELSSQLLPVVERIFNDDRILFQGLLYRVDIPEKNYKAALSESNKEEIPRTLTELIIRREFQKVLTRMYFSR